MRWKIAGWAMVAAACLCAHPDRAAGVECNDLLGRREFDTAALVLSGEYDILCAKLRALMVKKGGGFPVDLNSQELVATAKRTNAAIVCHTTQPTAGDLRGIVDQSFPNGLQQAPSYGLTFLQFNFPVDGNPKKVEEYGVFEEPGPVVGNQVQNVQVRGYSAAGFTTPVAIPLIADNGRLAVRIEGLVTGDDVVFTAIDGSGARTPVTTYAGVVHGRPHTAEIGVELPKKGDVVRSRGGTLEGALHGQTAEPLDRLSESCVLEGDARDAIDAADGATAKTKLDEAMAKIDASLLALSTIPTIKGVSRKKVSTALKHARALDAKAGLAAQAADFDGAKQLLTRAVLEKCKAGMELKGEGRNKQACKDMKALLL